MKKFLILDVNNIVFRSYHSTKEEELTAPLAYYQILTMLNYYYKKYAATDIVLAFDSPNNWRKIYTLDKDHCVTRKIYKGNREKNKTEAELNKLNDFRSKIVEFSDILKENTGLVVLRAKHLEADDLIAGMTQKFKDDHHIIISSDRDFIQLLDNPNVFITDPASDKQRTLHEWDDDAKYFMFQKCFKGDDGDNVQNAYPFIRKTKIKAAYTDKVVFTNLMKHKFKVEFLKDDKLEQYEYMTQDLFEENQYLMDLSKQPDFIRDLINETIDFAFKNRGIYNMFKFMKFCSKHELIDIIENIDKYNKLLSGRGITEFVI